jgi:hypothetical protein
MLTIGVDPHKRTHSVVAVDELGVQLAISTQRARRGVRDPAGVVAVAARHALAVVRAALREGLSILPAARLGGPELEIRLLAVHRERLVGARTRLINELRWQLHDLWPDYEVPKRALIRPSEARASAGPRRRVGARNVKPIRSPRRKPVRRPDNYSGSVFPAVKGGWGSVRSGARAARVGLRS